MFGGETWPFLPYYFGARKKHELSWRRKVAVRWEAALSFSPEVQKFTRAGKMGRDICNPEREDNTAARRERLLSTGGAVLILLVVSLLPFWHAGYRWDRMNDDTYITLTFARNLAAGRGFVYNYPPPTFGSTTPLLVLILAGLTTVMPWIGLPKLATYFTTLCWVGRSWLFFLFRRHFSITTWQSTLICVLLLTTTDSVFLGMEAYLFQLLMVLAIAMAMAKWWLASGFIIGLLHLTRGEGILLLPSVALAMGGHAYFTEQRSLREIGKEWVRLILGAVPPVLAWSLYAYLTFGRILPNTLSSKQAQIPGLHSGRPFSEVWFDWVVSLGGNFGGVLFLELGCWVLVIIALIEVYRRKRGWAAFGFFFVAYVAGYSLLGVRAFHWYALPMYFVWQVYLGLGMSVVALWLFRAPQRWRWVSRVAAVTLVALVCIGPVIRYGMKTMSYDGDDRATCYLELCEWLRNNTERGSSVAFFDVGYLGYFTDNKIIDLFGLVTPDMIPYLAINDRVSGFWKHRPDYYVFLAGDRPYMRILRSRGFSEEYRLVHRVYGRPPRKRLDIYKRMKQEVAGGFPQPSAGAAQR